MATIQGYIRFPTKLFELRDAGTFIPMLAVKLLVHDHDSRNIAERNADEHEEFLLRRAGYCRDEILDHGEDLEPYILLINLISNEATYDPFKWSNHHTYTPAHLYIRSNWELLVSGQVIDVEFLRGERTEPKKSEMGGARNRLR